MQNVVGLKAVIKILQICDTQKNAFNFTKTVVFLDSIFDLPCTLSLTGLESFVMAKFLAEH